MKQKINYILKDNEIQDIMDSIDDSDEQKELEILKLILQHNILDNIITEKIGQSDIFNSGNRKK